MLLPTNNITMFNTLRVALNIATHLGNIFYDKNFKPIAILTEQRLQVVTLVDGSYCPANRVSLLEESLDNPDRDESICTRNKDFGGGFDDGHFVMSNVALIQRLLGVNILVFHVLGHVTLDCQPGGRTRVPLISSISSAVSFIVVYLIRNEVPVDTIPVLVEIPRSRLFPSPYCKFEPHLAQLCYSVLVALYFSKWFTSFPFSFNFVDGTLRFSSSIRRLRRNTSDSSWKR
jgi:hypothetical protein